MPHGVNTTLSTHPSPPRRKQHSARFIFALALILLIIGAALAAPLLTPFDPTQPRPTESLQAPSAKHLAGADLFGRDVFGRTLWGGRQSLAAAAIALSLAIAPGALLGIISAQIGGRWDAILMRVVDVLLAFPGLLLALTFIAWLGPGLLSAAVAVGLAGIPRFARVMRADALRIRSREYIEAAYAVGCTTWRIVWRHLLPNVIDSLLVLAALELGFALLNISGLSFLGLGAQPPTAEWGLMLAEGRGLLRTAPWVATFPGLAITLTVLALNLLADVIQDRLIPGR
jgi:peptide/nickel transport system permease protein